MSAYAYMSVYVSVCGVVCIGVNTHTHMWVNLQSRAVFLELNVEQTSMLSNIAKNGPHSSLATGSWCIWRGQCLCP